MGERREFEADAVHGAQGSLSISHACGSERRRGPMGGRVHGEAGFGVARRSLQVSGFGIFSLSTDFGVPANAEHRGRTLPGIDYSMLECTETPLNDFRGLSTP
jgi:hypothetical protein